MKTTRNYNISMVRGDTLAFAFEITGIADSVDTAFFSCKTNTYDDYYIFQKSLGNGITMVESGKYRVRVAPEDTKQVETGAYYYDLEIGINTDIYTILKGKLRIEPDITRRN